MSISAGNIIIIIGLCMAGGIMIWQFITANQASSHDESTYFDDVEDVEDSIEETEEYMRRMERLSKRTIKKDDESKKK